MKNISTAIVPPINPDPPMYPKWAVITDIAKINLINPIAYYIQRHCDPTTAGWVDFEV